MRKIIYRTKKGIYLFWSLFFIALPIINFVPDLHFIKPYTIPILIFYTVMRLIKKISKAIFYTAISAGLIFLITNFL